MLLVLQRKEFNVAQSNQVDLSYNLAQQADYVKNDRITIRIKTQPKPSARRARQDNHSNIRKNQITKQSAGPPEPRADGARMVKYL